MNGDRQHRSEYEAATTPSLQVAASRPRGYLATTPILGVQDQSNWPVVPMSKARGIWQYLQWGTAYPVCGRRFTMLRPSWNP